MFRFQLTVFFLLLVLRRTVTSESVESCYELYSALKSTNITDIEITRSFDCDTSTWNSTIVLKRSVTIRGRERDKQVPLIDFATSSKGIIAQNGAIVHFTKLILIENEMGIGNVDIPVFYAGDNGEGIFKFVVIGVLSCPTQLDASQLESIPRPEDAAGRQTGKNIGNGVVEAQDVIIYWPSRNAQVDFHDAVFVCNVVKNDPVLQKYYHRVMVDSGNYEFNQNREIEEKSIAKWKLVLYIVLAAGTIVVCVFLAWFMNAWHREGELMKAEERQRRANNEFPMDFEPEESMKYQDLLSSNVKLEEPLGHGAMGKVYKGVWQGTTVAVKVIKHDEVRVRTNQGEPLEALLAKHISHPNVIQTYHISNKRPPEGELERSVVPLSNPRPRPLISCTDSDDMFDLFEENNDIQASPEAEGVFETWLILEYCDKGSLADAIVSGVFHVEGKENEYRMSFVAKTALEIASAMNYLHSLRIIHGDLKCGNVLLKSNGSDPRGFICKVGDFGLSRFLEEDAAVSTLTCGTTTHMPPETLKDGIMTSSVDVYAFAILLWELLSGKEAYQGKNEAEIVLAVVSKGKRPSFPPGVPADFMNLIEKCWSQNQADRPLFPKIIDKLSTLLAKYEREEGLTEAPQSSKREEGAKSSFFSPEDSRRNDLREKRRSLRFVPKEFSSRNVTRSGNRLPNLLETHQSADALDTRSAKLEIMTTGSSRSCDSKAQ